MAKARSRSSPRRRASRTPPTTPPRRIFLAISGASGAIYGLRALELLQRQPGVQLHLCLSRGAGEVLRHEVGLKLPARPTAAELRKALHLRPATTLHPIEAIAAGPASGSFGIDTMLVTPCSMGTLAAIARGLADNLIQRAAAVMLKERRRLIVVPRETPLSLIHIENMLKVTQAGGIVLPAMPGFYGRPQTVADMVDFVVGRCFDLAGINAGRIGVHWKGPTETTTP